MIIMMNNRGWLRIVEASIAVLIVLSTLAVVYVRTGSSNQPDFSEKARDILNEMATNNTLRKTILDYNLGDNLEGFEKAENEALMKIINESVRARLQQANMEFELRICKIGDVCGKSVHTPENVYVAERIISTYIGKYEQITPEEAKKARLFIWRSSE